MKMNKYNCWEFMKCGRGVGGDKVDELGVCPVATETFANGLKGGINRGRLCWVISGNGCKDNVKCSDLHHKNSCFQFEFRYKVTMEEGLVTICRETGLFLNNALYHTNYVERRSIKRLPASINVRFMNHNTTYNGTVTNISKKGMFIETERINFPFNPQFNIAIPLNKKMMNIRANLSRMMKSRNSYKGLGFDLRNPPQEYLKFMEICYKRSE
jgi:hypothetical protein